MPEKIEDLRGFILAVIKLLNIVNNSSSVLFRLEFRKNLAESVEEVISDLQKLSESVYIFGPDSLNNNDVTDRIRRAGLSGSQLMLKLESFQNSKVEFENEGGIDNLELALSKGAIILGSLAGAIPSFGSFAQEFLNFIIKELKKRFKFWKK